jgi:hypothetical protein
LPRPECENCAGEEHGRGQAATQSAKKVRPGVQFRAATLLEDVKRGQSFFTVNQKEKNASFTQDRHRRFAGSDSTFDNSSHLYYLFPNI